MSIDITKTLINLGLTASETKLYLAGLKLGPTSVQELAKKSKLSRTAAYEIVSSLQDKGLFTTYERGKKKFFSAETPESVVAHFKNRMLKLGEQLMSLERALPEIKLMVGGERPTVRVFEGDEAIYMAFHDAQTVRPKEIRELANIEDINDKLNPEILKEAKKVLNDGNCKFKILHRGDLNNPRPGREVCKLPDDFGSFHGDLWIYGDRIVFITFVGKITAIIIESQVFSDMARILFDVAWEVCRVINHDTHKIT